MKKISLLLIMIALGFGGRFGIGLAGGGQYPDDHKITMDRLPDLVYGAEFNLQAEALPNIYLEPSVSYFSNTRLSQSSAGVGLGINLRPRFGNFFLVPSFGLKGTILFLNDLSLGQAISNGQLTKYIGSSTPQLSYTAFAGMGICLSKKLSLECNYRYLQLAPAYRVEMVWAGLSYYINW